MLCYVSECTYRHTLNKLAPHWLAKMELTPGLVVTCQLSIIRTVKLLLVTAVKRLLTRWSKARPTCCCYSVHVGVVERLCNSVSMHCQGSPAPPTSSQKEMLQFKNFLNWLVLLAECNHWSFYCWQLIALDFSINQLLFFSYYYNYSY